MHARAWSGSLRRSSLRPEPVPGSDSDYSSLVDRLRAAGCVFAEEEATILRQTADGEILSELLARRIAGEPLEQIVGWVEFGGSRLNVVPGVFVPRQRTTLLAEQTIREIEEVGPGARLLEAFCGVGPIAATVSRAVPGTQIHLSDHDGKALDCARTNAGPEAQYHQSSCLAGLAEELAGSFNVISAVPPYVPDSAAHFLPREAIDHEAPTALFGGADGLDLVRNLISEAPHWLAPDGALLIELGSGQHRTAGDFAATVGFQPRAYPHRGEDEQTVVLEIRRLLPAIR